MIELSRKQFVPWSAFRWKNLRLRVEAGFLSANLAFALDRSDIAPGLKEVLREMGFTGKGG